MRRTAAVAAALMLAATACAGADAGERIVQVDFSHDEFASSLILNFPENVTVHPGQTLVFRQTWTGEPHTVTGGRLVDENLELFEPWDDFFFAYDDLLATGAELPEPDAPGEATFADFAEGVAEAEDAELSDLLVESYRALTAVYDDLPDIDDPPDLSFEEFVELVEELSGEIFAVLPFAWDEDDNLAQNVSQPCYRTEGGPPADPQTACPPQEQVQPVFDGTHSYYNSGIIPFEGPAGNTFGLDLAEDLEPGTYTFYCAVHGPAQRTAVEVVEPGTDIPSQQDVARQARQEISRLADPLRTHYNRALETGTIEGPRGNVIEGPFAGLARMGPGFPSFINEFIPQRAEVAVGEPFTWKLMGAPHTISFDVPEYFPIVEFAPDGTVSINELIDPPAGGAPDLPPPPVLAESPSIDGGTYDGRGFWSSGLIETFAAPEGFVEYTLRISEPGAYRYACLLHPPMVGTIVVTED